jgi:hypothetical protein
MGEVQQRRVTSVQGGVFQAKRFRPRFAIPRSALSAASTGLTRPSFLQAKVNMYRTNKHRPVLRLDRPTSIAWQRLKLP